MRQNTIDPNDPILGQLNDQQKAAVLADDGPNLIIAGAGSGKTRVIINRIATLMKEGVPPQEILALTFTNKAAGEMRKRIQELAGDEARGLVMGTFHSVFVRFLREWHTYIGFPANFIIYDADDAKACLKDTIGITLYGEKWNDKEEIKKLSDNEKAERKKALEITYNIKEVAGRISYLKNKYITPKRYERDKECINYDHGLNRERLGDIYELYMKRCKRAAAMDFDDILVYMNYMLEENIQFRKYYAMRFRHILVDEYQDTNAIQYNIVLHLISQWGNLYAVGDDSQSIYAFRGARIENILNLERQFPNLKTYKLETNYRSTPQIVETANILIEKNINRIPKTCVAHNPSGLPIKTELLYNDREEARYIAKTIRKRHDAGEKYSDFAILYRTNAQSRQLEETFIREHIPYVIFSGTSFFNRQEIKDVLAYIRLTINPNDDESFKRICNRPARGISENTLTTITADAEFAGVSFTESARFITENPEGVKPRTVTAIKKFLELMDKVRTDIKSKNAYEAIQLIANETGIYTLYAEDQKDDDGRKRTENIQDFLNGVSYFIDDYKEENNDAVPTISDYLENVSLMTSADTKYDKNADTVFLMTSHCSKGLEFPTVIIAGVEEELFPSCFKNDPPTKTEEERRLFYVSMTRAQRELIMTYCETRWKFNDIKYCKPSRFLYETGLIEKQENE